MNPIQKYPHIIELPAFYSKYVCSDVLMTKIFLKISLRTCSTPKESK